MICLKLSYAESTVGCEQKRRGKRVSSQRIIYANDFPGCFTLTCRIAKSMKYFITPATYMLILKYYFYADTLNVRYNILDKSLRDNQKAENSSF